MGSATATGLLYERQIATLVASWAVEAAGAPGASLWTEEDVTVCRFPAGPERDIFNNALLARGMDAGRSERAVAAMERAYDDAGIRRYAAWVHETDAVTIAALTGRGYRLEESTRAMAMSLDDLASPPPDIDAGLADWAAYLRILCAEGLPDGLLAGVDPHAFHVHIARLDGRDVASALAYDHDGDCGIFNVGTFPEARRRGLGGALTALVLHAARDRGCTTASLQATPMAERLYASLGFLDLGRFLEYVPA
jgi:ribosomal protein S18 acetylase RimI-like enzyme